MLFILKRNTNILYDLLLYDVWYMGYLMVLSYMMAICSNLRIIEY